MTLSQDNFVELMHGFDDLDMPPLVGRSESIHRRIRRARRRRRTAAAGALAVVLVAASAVALLAPAPPPAALTPAPLPQSWTAADGVVYQRIGTATIDTAHSATQKTTVTVPVGSEPIAVVSVCEVHQRPGYLQAAEARINFGGKPDYTTGSVNCGDGDLSSLDPALANATRLTEYDPASVVHPAGKVRIEFDGGLGAYIDPNVERAVEPHVVKGKWTFGIYTWQVPATLASPASAPPMPDLLFGRWKLQQALTGTWPNSRSESISVPRGTRWGYIFYCPSSLAGSLSYVPASTRPDDTKVVNALNVASNGHLRGGEGCGWAGGIHDYNIVDMSTVGRKAGETESFTLDFADIYRARTGNWSIGIYFDEKSK